MRGIHVDKPDVRERLARSSADETSPANGERACTECGVGLGDVHGNRRYHPECGKAIRSRKAATHSARYRNRRRNERQGGPPPEPPPDYRNGIARARGVSLPGQRVLELRAALNPFLAALIEHHLALKKFSSREVTSDPHKMALRVFVDEGFTLVGLLDAYLPGVIVEPGHDLLDLVDKQVTKIEARRR